MKVLRNVFHKAQESMQSHYLPNLITDFNADHLLRAQKFVMPDAGKMIHGKLFSDYFDCFKLPFDAIALSREIEVDGKIIQQICICVDAKPYRDRWANFHADFLISDVIQVDERWAPTRPIGVSIDKSIGGMVVFEIPGLKELEMGLTGCDGVFGVESEGWGALNGVFELLVMLSTSNVQSQIVRADEKLNVKRIKRGRIPLYDYHVLTIDGKPTSEIDGGTSSDRVMRSHFRRGHIRRLDDGRRIWVRSSYVHGKANGFIDKDYLIAP